MRCSNLSSHPARAKQAKAIHNLRAIARRVGVIVGAYSALNLVGNLGAGAWIDRAGRRLPLLVGLVIVGLALLLYPFVRDPYALLGLRAIHGLGVLLAYIGDVAIAGARALALYSSAIGLTSMLAPPFAGMIRDRFGFGAVFGALAAMMFLVALAEDWFIGESAPRVQTQTARAGMSLRKPRLLFAFVAAFCLLFSLGTLIVFLPLIGKEIGVNSMRVGLWFAGFGVAAVIIQLVLGRLSDRTGREPVMLAGFVITILALFLLPMMRDWETMLSVMALYGIGFGVLFPAMTALLADETDTATRGTAAGIYRRSIHSARRQARPRRARWCVTTKCRDSSVSIRGGDRFAWCGVGGANVNASRMSRVKHSGARRLTIGA
jgi:MFS family permease